MPIEAAALSSLSITPLHFLVDEILKVLLPDLSLLVLVLVLHNVLLRFLVECDEQLEVLVDLRVLVQLHAAHVMRVGHIFEDAPDLVGAVLTLDIFRVAVNVPADFAHERVSRALEHQTDAEVRVILLLLQACLDQPCLARHATNLLLRQLLSHDLETADLTGQQLLLVSQVPLELLVLLDDALEGNGDLAAAFHELLPEEFVLDPCILKPLQHRVLLVDSLDFSVLHLVEDVRAVLVVARQRLVLQLVVLQVHDLLQVEDVVDALQDVADQLLLVLDLDGGVGHQQRVRDGHVDPLDLVVVAAGVVLVAAVATDVEGRLFVRGHAVVLVESTVVLRHAASAGVLVPVVEVDVPWVDYSLLEVVRANLVRAAYLAVHARAVAAVRLAHVIHIYVYAHFCAATVRCRVGLLCGLGRLGVGLVVIIVSAWAATASRWSGSLRVY